MRQNISLRRIIVLVLTSVLLSALATLFIYSIFSPQIFAQAKLDELIPRANYLAEQARGFFPGGEAYALGQNTAVFGMNVEQLGARVYVVDSNRNVIANNDSSTPQSEYTVNIADFESLLRQVLAGEEVHHLSYLLTETNGSERAADMLIVGIPILHGEEVVGALMMLKSLEEIVSAMSTLSYALWISMFAVLLVMTPLIYWFSRRITMPLRQMRDVAFRMAGGDFTIRANDNEKGEMGDLARALNHLASELGNTIAELTRERNQAVTIVNALGEGVLSVNTEGLPMMTNPALQTMLISAGHGNPLPLPAEVWEDFQIVLKENRCTDSSFLLGDLLLHLTVTPIYDQHADAVTAIGVFHDETQAHHLEQTRREYVANVSHELRTPLTALRALIEPLRDGLIRTEAQRQDTYGIILRETMRLSRLVDDMLELSRLQSGRLALEKVRFKVEPLLRETASTYSAKATGTGHLLLLDLPEKALPSVLGNPDRVEQVLVSLMNNAFRYTPAGSHITLRAEDMPDCLHITVEDDGPGVAQEDLPHVFDRFYKADKSHGGTAGTGLGLAISREVMERLGEIIFVENRPQGGARFTFTLHYE